MKKKFILLASSIACFISIQSVYAASMSKTLRGTCAGTSASVTATYYTHETTRWKVGSPTNIGYSGKGGYATKSGSPSTYKIKPSFYHCEQKVIFSSTDYNYVSHSGSMIYHWSVDGATDKWSTCNIK